MPDPGEVRPGGGGAGIAVQVVGVLVALEGRRRVPGVGQGRAPGGEGIGQGRLQRRLGVRGGVGGQPRLQERLGVREPPA